MHFDGRLFLLFFDDVTTIRYLLKYFVAVEIVVVQVSRRDIFLALKTSVLIASVCHAVFMIAACSYEDIAGSVFKFQLLLPVERTHLTYRRNALILFRVLFLLNQKKFPEVELL